MALGSNLFILNLPAFANKNTWFLTVSVDTVHIAISQPSKHQSERSDWVLVQWVTFCWVCAAGLLEPLPRPTLWSNSDSILVTFGNMETAI